MMVDLCEEADCDDERDDPKITAPILCVGGSAAARGTVLQAAARETTNASPRRVGHET